MSVGDEFKTVDLVLASGAKTQAVDAFALSLIKAEKQVRRLVTYLIYQHPWCVPATVRPLINALEKSNDVYFDGLLRGWNALYPRSVEQLVGPEYTRLRARLTQATKIQKQDLPWTTYWPGPRHVGPRSLRKRYPRMV